MSSNDKNDYSRDADRLFDEVVGLKKQVESLSRAQDTNRTTLSGQIIIRGKDGVEMVIGGDKPGKPPIEYADGPEPAQPETPEVDMEQGSITLTMDGYDVEGAPAPGDFRRVRVHRSRDAEFEPSAATYRTSVENPKGEVSMAVPGGLWYVAIQWETLSGKLSKLSEVQEVDVTPLVDVDDIQEALDEAQDRLDEAKKEFEEGNDARKDEIEDLRDNVIPSLEAMLADKADKSALGELDDKIDAIEMPDISGLPTKEEVESLTQAAEQAAKEHADLVADGAKSEAIAEAEAKADAAKEAAEQAAKDYADQVGQQARADAAADAQEKADAVREVAENALKRADSVLNRGDNLVVNGSGGEGDTTAWPERIEFDASMAPSGYPGAFTYTGSYNYEFTQTDKITIDPQRVYRMSAMIHGKEGMRHYLAIAEYDVDGTRIGHEMANRVAGSETKLAEPVKNGDTSITVEDASGWDAEAPSMRVGLWPYETQAGRVYQIEDGYTANVHITKTPSVEGNVIHLGTPWTMGDFPAGTDVAHMRTGSAYLYPQNKTQTEDGWELYTGRTSAGAKSGIYGEGNSKQWRPGTAKIAVGFLMNYQANVEEYPYFTGVRFVDATDEKGVEEALAEAEDAIDRANKAQEYADDAHKEAGEAKDAADAAMDRAGAAEDYADGLPKVLHGTSAPSGTAPDESTWFQHQDDLSGPVIAQWTMVDGSWKSTEIASEAIANLDVGKLTAGSAEVAEGVFGKLWASDVAVENLQAVEGWIGGVALEGGAIGAQQINVNDVFANEAVIDKIWADVVRARMLTAEEAFIGGALLKDNTIDVEKINVTEELTGALAQFLHLVVDQMDVNALWADEAWLTAIKTSEVELSSVINSWKTLLSGRGMEVLNPEGQPTIQLGNYEENGLTLYGEVDTGDEEDEGEDPGEPGGDLEALVSITDDGSISGEVISANEEFYYQGTEISELVDTEMLPKGAIAYGEIDMSGREYTSPSHIGFLEVSFDAEAGRAYQVVVEPYRVMDVTFQRIVITFGGRAPTISMNANTSGAQVYTTKIPDTVGGGTFRINPVSSDQLVRILVGVYSGTAGIRFPSVTGNVVMTVSDMGLAAENTGVARSSTVVPGGSSSPDVKPPKTKTRRVKTYSRSWWRTWWQNGNIPSSGVGKTVAAQGRTPYFTSAGTYRSMIGFPSLTSLLSGADVEKIEIRVKVTHSHSGKGGNVRLGTHNNTSRPSRYTGYSNAESTNTKFGRGQEKWITLPKSLYNGFKNGTYRGVTMFTSSTSTSYYVQASPSRFAIRVTYRK